MLVTNFCSIAVNWFPFQIYNNWIFDVVAIVFFPVWICLWVVVLTKAPAADPLTELGVGENSTEADKDAAKMVKSN